ncbi:hypothetical protein NB636_04990 [Oxalobacter aliiformigenes]|uniref:hypothetical protein n=1 Tax=Oxalobacter aliiformigenes TaxID=2946593 RepID=UPI0022AE9892|nr:hypothetical protein [Oxalobacter aliiformigenes]MCZ4065988.1 hypothetical protein [Oxalobacter aliiformigenes]WAW00204.1 hypothetical protein NB636_04990 [Oxalobacter aliiformigenes]
MKGMGREAIVPIRFAKAGGPVAGSPDGVACGAFFPEAVSGMAIRSGNGSSCGGETQPSCMESLEGKRPVPESACVKICL